MEDFVREGLSSEEKFSVFLEDEIFVDYFNTFLSLPVFGKRMLYRQDLRLFEVDPGPEQCDNYYVQADILSWILAERCPIFYGTDICNEFRLCKFFQQELLKQDFEGNYNLDLQNELGNVLAMQRFKAFLCDSVGERNLLFWLAAEKFRRQTPEEDRRFVLREIQDKFIKQGAWLELSNCIKSTFKSSLDRWNGARDKMENFRVIPSDILLEPQNEAFASFVGYWLPKYFAHRSHRRNVLRNKWRKAAKSPKIPRKAPSNEERKHYSLYSVYQDVRDRQNSSQSSSKTDESLHSDASETELDIFLEDSCPKGKEQKNSFHMLDRMTDDLKLHGSRSFDDSESSNMIITIDDEDDSDASNPDHNKENLKLPRIKCSRISIAAQQNMATTNRISYDMPICAGDVQTSCNDLREASLSKAITLNQTIRQASLLDVEPNLAFPAAFLVDSSSMSCQAENHLEHLSAALSSDPFAGQPFCKYIKLINNDEAFANIRFWTAAQHYLSNLTHMDTLTRHRQAYALIHIYLCRDSPRKTSLSLDLRSRLCDQLPKDLGLATLALACVQCAKALYPFWSEFVQIDESNFNRNVSCRISSSTFYSTVRGEQEKVLRHSRRRKRRENVPPKRIWNALQLAIAISVPRTARPLLEGYEDVDDDDPKRNYQGSLHSRQLRILNQQAIKALEDYRKCNPYQNAMAYHFYQQNFLISTMANKPTENDRVATITKELPNKHHRDTRSRLARPRTFQEILHDPVQLEAFKKFLIKHDADCALLFWQAVESMRTNTREAKQRQSRANGILRRFFGASTNQGKALSCNADIVKELPYMTRVTPAMLVSAQTCVARSMEENWFIQYLASFPEEDELPGITKLPHYRTFQVPGSEPNRGMRQKIRGLWKIFARNVISFKRGIANQRTLKHFQNFLKSENEFNVKRSKEQGEEVPQRVLISSKLVFTDKLIHDLRFWSEVDRYKEFADAVVLCAKLGNYTKDDELIVVKKAKAILNCFLDSQIPPRVQVNVSVDIADNIMNLVKNDIIERGLFHEAALSVFSVLLHYWKKFCYFRLLPKVRLPKSSESVYSDRSNQIALKKEAIRRNVVRRVSIQPDDEYTKLMFSLQNGLRLAVVPIEEDSPVGIQKLPKINTIRISKTTRV